MNDYRERRTERMIANYAARLRAGQVGMRRDGLTKAQEERSAAGGIEGIEGHFPNF